VSCARRRSVTLASWQLTNILHEARQFGVHPIKYEDSDTTNVASRLADNFEAYIYALYLDQGIETVYKFLAPIFLKKLYSQARQLEIPIPTQKIALELQPDGSFKQPGLVSRISKPSEQIIGIKRFHPSRIFC
jgi:dsRNA-specific ribonuclease